MNEKRRRANALMTKYYSGMIDEGSWKTAAGDIAVFNTKYRRNLKSLTVQLEPIQAGSGDPSPDNVRPISGRTGATVYRTGKNLCEVTSVSDVGWARQSPLITNILNTLEFGTYTISFDYTITSVRDIYTSDTAKAVTGRFNIFANGSIKVGTPGIEITRSQALSGYSDKVVLTFNVTAENKGQFTTVYFYGLGRGTYAEGAPNGSLGYADITNIQIENGTTATDYNPYTGTTYPVSWETEAGTVYGGTVDAVSGVLTVNNAYVNIADINSINLYNVAQGKLYRCSLPMIKTISSTYAIPELMATNYKITSQSQRANNTISMPDNSQVIDVIDNRYSTIEEFRAGDIGFVVYPLAEPVTYQLTPQQIQTLIGENVIWSDAGAVSVEYWS